jgi:hypothetical protein
MAPVPETEPATQAAENIAGPAENKTETVIIAPETVIPPAAENIATPVVTENATQPKAPVNETKAETPVAVNLTPVLSSLTSDLTSPQPPGATITWTANATASSRMDRQPAVPGSP